VTPRPQLQSPQSCEQLTQVSPQSQRPLPHGLPQSLEQQVSPQLQTPSPHCVPQSAQQLDVVSPPRQQPSPQPLGQSGQQLDAFSPTSQQPSVQKDVGQSAGQVQCASGKRHTPSPQ